MIRLLQGWLIAMLALMAGTAAAHELSMAEMQVREMARGEFFWQWSASERRAPAEVLTPVWPEGCRAEQNVLRCGAAGLAGTLTMQGVGDQYSAAMVKVFWQIGRAHV